MGNRNKLIGLALAAAFFIFQNCKNAIANERANFTLNPAFEDLLTHFTSSLDTADSAAVFVVIKNIDANTANVYMVAKKPQRTDFQVIGIPSTAIKYHQRDIYFFTGIEKIAFQDTLFWKEHPEIIDDRKKSLYEPPVLKKELYTLDDSIWHQEGHFGEIIFIGNPIDTVRWVRY